jgi:hypothetical protein
MTMCRSSLIGLTVCALIAFTAGSSVAQAQNVSGASSPQQAPVGSATQLPAPVYPAVAPSAQEAPNSSASVPPYATANAAPVALMASPAPAAYPNDGTPRAASATATATTNAFNAPNPKVTDWSLGAGVQYGLLGDAGLTSLSSSLSASSGSTTPSIRTSVFMERRLWKHTYLLVQPDFDYTKYNHNSPTAATATVIDRSTSVGLSAGLRWVANPGGVVELGMAHLIDFDWTQRTGSVQQDYQTALGIMSRRTRAELNIYDVGLSTGIVAEYQLMSALWLRMNVPFLRVTYAKASLKERDLGNVVLSESNVGASLYAAPRLELRLTW